MLEEDYWKITTTNRYSSEIEFNEGTLTINGREGKYSKTIEEPTLEELFEEVEYALHENGWTSLGNLSKCPASIEDMIELLDLWENIERENVSYTKIRPTSPIPKF